MAVANRKIKFSGKTFVTPTSGGGGSSNLTVEEQDGNPTVTPVTTIKVTNGTLTDEGGGVVSIVTGGGGGGGGAPGGASGAVQYNDGAGGFAGATAQFFYDAANLRVGIGTQTPARKLHVEEVTTQLRLAYDATGYVDLYADAGGDLQVIPEGGATYQNASAVNSYTRHGSYVLTATTTTAATTALTLSPGGGTMTLTTNTNWFFDGIFVGKQDASSNSLTIKLEGVVQRQGGAASILGAVFKFVVHDDSGDVWDVNATASGNNLVVNVSGQAGTTISWTGHLRTTEVQD
jgi:hypothetical protein